MNADHTWISLGKLGDIVGKLALRGSIVVSSQVESFAALLDTGHSRLCYVAPQHFIRDMPKGSIQALHIQDMRGIEGQDDHLLPGMGKLKWDEILKALAEVDYDGDFNMEVHGFHKCFEVADLPVAVKLAESVGRRCIEKLEQFKKSEAAKA